MKYNRTNLKEVLEAHKRWLNETDGWTEDDRANLYRANLSGADLSGANLSGANLSGADLYRVNLSGADNIPFIPMACPDTGAFVGWKKCRAHGKHNEELIVKLLIPEDARRSSGTGRQCRCDKALVLEVQNMDGSVVDKTAYATTIGHTTFEYRAGEVVTPEEAFDEDRFNECASGIHFFINREEAVRY